MRSPSFCSFLLCRPWLFLSVTFSSDPLRSSNHPRLPIAQGKIPINPIRSSRQLIQEGVFGNVITFAGNGQDGLTNGLGTNSQFSGPRGISVSPDAVYALVADYENNLIRQIILSTASVISFASASGPTGVDISPDGGFALIVEYVSHRIRHVAISGASDRTLAGEVGVSGSSNGVGTNSRFKFPYGVAFSPSGVYALVGDGGNHLVRQIIISTASVTTLAGPSGFSTPRGVSVSPDGLYALVTDISTHKISHIMISTATVTTLAGNGNNGNTNGIGSNSLFNLPYGIAISPNGVFALVVDAYNQLIRQIIISTASVTTLAGNGSVGSTNGIGSNSQFYRPYGIAISPDGAYALVSDTYNKLIRKITLNTMVPSPSSHPTRLSTPTAANPTRFVFGVLIGDEGIISSEKAVLVDYLQDARRGKMIPISRIVKATEISSSSDPPLSSDSILIKWRPVSAVSGIGSWEDSNHTILPFPVGGVFVSWLVSLLSEEIKGFIVKHPMSSSYLIHFIDYPNSPSSSDCGISVSISPNKTLSARTLGEYVAGVSGQRLYLLNSGLVR